MNKLHFSAAAVAAALLLTGVVAGPAAADPPASTGAVDLSPLPSTINLPAPGKTKTYSYTVPIVNPTPGIRYWVSALSVSQGTSVPISGDFSYPAPNAVTLKFSVVGGDVANGPRGPYAGKQTVSVTLEGEDDSVSETITPVTTTKPVLLVAHDAKPANVRVASGAYHPHKTFVIGGQTAVSGIGAAAGLYLKKTGSKHYVKIASAKVKLLHFPSPDAIDTGYFRLSTKKLVAGSVYVKITSHGSPATAKSKILKFTPRGGGNYSLR